MCYTTRANDCVIDGLLVIQSCHVVLYVGLLAMLFARIIVATLFVRVKGYIISRVKGYEIKVIVLLIGLSVVLRDCGLLGYWPCYRSGYRQLAFSHRHNLPIRNLPEYLQFQYLAKTRNLSSRLMYIKYRLDRLAPWPVLLSG